MKTVLMTSFNPLISRNIIQTDIIPILLENDIKITIAVYDSRSEYFRKNFEREGIKIVSVSKEGHRWDAFLQFVSMSLINTNNMYVRGFYDNKKYFQYVFAHILYWTVGQSFGLKMAARKIILKFLYNKNFEELLKNTSPDTVFSTDIFNWNDMKILKAAGDFGIKTIGMVRSWDNALSKGLLLVTPDRMIVPNGVLQEEMLEYHRVAPEKIFVSGIPHYDYCVAERGTTKAEFCGKMKLDPNKKTILLAPAESRFYKYDAEIFKLLKRLKDNGAFSEPVQFLVRVSPSGIVDMRDFVSDNDFIFDYPGITFDGQKKESEMSPADAAHLNDTLYYSDIVITFISSMAIDAAVFNKPTIIIFFDPRGCEDDSVKKFLHFAHIKKLFVSGLCRIAESENDLIGVINGYLANPCLDEEKRREIVRRYCYKLDKQSSKRVAEFLLRHI